MKLTKEEWFHKLKSNIQSWVLKEPRADAVFRGIAAALSQIDSDFDDHLNQTYIDLAEREFVAMHGEERSVAEIQGETLLSFRERVKRVTAQSNFPELKAVVDSFLTNGESFFIEHSHDTGSFMSVGMCLNRDLFDFTVLYNAFTIIVPKQYGEDSDLIFENIVRAINKNKAAGVVYRIIERVN